MNPLLAMIATFALASCMTSCEPRRCGPARAETAPPQDEKRQGNRAAADYAHLRVRVLKWNQRYEPSAWWMNSEHLFIYDEQLMNEAIAYVRQEGGLDYLFGRVLEPNTPDEDLLVVAELMVYFGGYARDGDDNVKSALAAAVELALAHGRTDSAEQRYPNAPIRQKISDAAKKASRA